MAQHLNQYSVWRIPRAGLRMVTESRGDGSSGQGWPLGEDIIKAAPNMPLDCPWKAKNNQGLHLFVLKDLFI